MNFANIFSNMMSSAETKDEQSNWIKCPKCLALMYYKEIDAKRSVCPKCDHHFRINAEKREE
ncbi:MAG: Acetyl-coenzyme A carboxyl transferase beta chain (EC, partial [uncultured Sulfurovum sp.]